MHLKISINNSKATKKNWFELGWFAGYRKRL